MLRFLSIGLAFVMVLQVVSPASAGPRLKRTDNNPFATFSEADARAGFDIDDQEVSGVTGSLASATASDAFLDLSMMIHVDGSSTVSLAFNQVAKVITLDSTANVTTSMTGEGADVSGGTEFQSDASFSPIQTTTRLEINMLLIVSGGGTTADWGPRNSYLSSGAAGWSLAASPMVDGGWFIDYVDGQNPADDFSGTEGSTFTLLVADTWDAAHGEDFDDLTFGISSTIDIAWLHVNETEGTVGELYGFSASAWVKADNDK